MAGIKLKNALAIALVTMDALATEGPVVMPRVPMRFRSKGAAPRGASGHARDGKVGSSHSPSPATNVSAQLALALWPTVMTVAQWAADEAVAKTCEPNGDGAMLVLKLVTQLAVTLAPFVAPRVLGPGGAGPRACSGWRGSWTSARRSPASTRRRSTCSAALSTAPASRHGRSLLLA